MAIPSRMQDRILVLSKLKQGTYGTALTDVNLQAGKRFDPEAAVFMHRDLKRWTDRGLAMRGHDYATLVQETERDLADQMSFPGDTWLLAWFAAMAMGKVTSTQPDAVGAPTAWQHVIKPQDPSVDGKDLPVTTIYAEAANTANLQRRILDCHVKDFAVEFPLSAPLRVSGSVVGSGRVTTGALAGPPALATLNLLLSNDMTFAYGVQGAPADISAQIVAGSVKFGFSWNFDDGNSRAPGGGIYRSRAWVGRPDFTLEFQRFVDDAASTANDDWLAATVQEVKITVLGATIGAAVKHKIEIRGLAVIPQAVKIGQAGDKSVYQYSIGPDHWLKQAAADVCTVTAVNTESSFLV